MKVVFMGTPEFAVPILRALILSHDVGLVVTQPDRPKGRGRNISSPPVKSLAIEYNIPVVQPTKLKGNIEAYNLIKETKPDIIVVAAYGNILPKEILTLPPMGCINVHASLLPKYRGAAPINWAIINGEKVTGISIVKMSEKLDAGDIILMKPVEISDKDNALTLNSKLSQVGADALIEALNMIENGTAQYLSQDEDEATYAPMLSKDVGHINWGKTKREIVNLVRGTWPWPGAYFCMNGKVIKVLECSINNEEINGRPGEVVKVDKEGLCVACADGSIRITMLQPEGKRAMSVDEYIRGNRVEAGTILI